MLIDIVRQRKYVQQRDLENTTYEGEKLLWRLENALLRFERRLPPGSSASGGSDSILPESWPASRSHQPAVRALQRPRPSQATRELC